MVVFKKRGARDKTKKLLPRAIGPYMVKKKISSVCYQLEDIPHNKRSRIHRIFNAHVSIMKLYVPRRECDWEPWVSDEPEVGVREEFLTNSGVMNKTRAIFPMSRRMKVRANATS